MHPSARAHNNEAENWKKRSHSDESQNHLTKTTTTKILLRDRKTTGENWGMKQ